MYTIKIITTKLSILGKTKRFSLFVPPAITDLGIKIQTLKLIQ